MVDWATRTRLRATRRLALLWPKLTPEQVLTLREHGPEHVACRLRLLAEPEAVLAAEWVEHLLIGGKRR